MSRFTHSLVIMPAALIAALLFGGSVHADSESPSPRGYLLAPKVFRAAMAKVMPSVVTIETYGGINARPTKKSRGQMRGKSTKIAMVAIEITSV